MIDPATFSAIIINICVFLASMLKIYNQTVNNHDEIICHHNETKDKINELNLKTELMHDVIKNISEDSLSKKASLKSLLHNSPTSSEKNLNLHDIDIKDDKNIIEA